MCLKKKKRHRKRKMKRNKSVLLICLVLCGFLFTSFNVQGFQKNDLILMYYKPNNQNLLGLDVNSIVELNVSKYIPYYVYLTPNKEIIREVIVQCIRQSVPINLAFAVIEKESQFNSRAININYDKDGNIKSIDRGLFQLNSLSFLNLNEEDFFNYKTNIYYGVRYLKYCIDSFDSYSQALSAYNGGHYRVTYNDDVYEQITYQYVSDVIVLYAEFDKNFFVLARTEE